MSLIIVACISLVAIATAVLLGEQMDKTIFLHWEKAGKGLQKHLQDIGNNAVDFAVHCCDEGWFPKERVEKIAVYYILNIMEHYYKTKIRQQEEALEQVVRDILKERRFL